MSVEYTEEGTSVNMTQNRNAKGKGGPPKWKRRGKPRLVPLS